MTYYWVSFVRNEIGVGTAGHPSPVSAGDIVGGPDAMVVCASCGVDQRGDTAYCNSCGHKLVFESVLSKVGSARTSSLATDPFTAGNGGRSGAHSAGGQATAGKGSYTGRRNAPPPLAPGLVSPVLVSRPVESTPSAPQQLPDLPPTVAASSGPGREPSRVRGLMPRSRVIVVALVLGALIVSYLFRRPLSNAYASGIDQLSGVSATATVCSASSASMPGHGAGKLVDHRADQTWISSKAGAKGAWARCTLLQPARLVSLRVFNGASPANEKIYAAYGRLKSLSVTVTTAKGAKHTRVYTLADRPGAQDLEIGVSDARTVQLTVVSSVGRPLVALGEVAFQIRK